MARIETMHAAKPEEGRHLFEPQMVDAAPAARTMPRPQGRPGGGHAPSERLVPGVPVSKSETHSEPVRRPEPEAHP